MDFVSHCFCPSLKIIFLYVFNVIFPLNSLHIAFFFCYQHFLTSLVVETLKPMDPQRKCWRMIGNVLVERTVGEFLPAVQQNLEGVCITILICVYLPPVNIV